MVLAPILHGDEQNQSPDTTASSQWNKATFPSCATLQSELTDHESLLSCSESTVVPDSSQHADQPFMAVLRYPNENFLFSSVPASFPARYV
jgi:hypothetical protein